jgi:hypothetical protein
MKLTNRSIINHIYHFSNIEIYKVRNILLGMADVIKQELTNGNSVRIDDFGTFRTKKTTNGYYTIVFKPHEDFRKEFNKNCLLKQKCVYY